MGFNQQLISFNEIKKEASILRLNNFPYTECQDTAKLVWQIVNVCDGISSIAISVTIAKVVVDIFHADSTAANMLTLVA